MDKYKNESHADQEQVDKIGIFVWGVIFLDIAHSVIANENIKDKVGNNYYIKYRDMRNWKENAPTTRKLVKIVQI